MATPKGTRDLNIPLNATDAVHVYSNERRIWLQLRRDIPTTQDIGKPSFKVALSLTHNQAIALAKELLTAAMASTAVTEKVEIPAKASVLAVSAKAKPQPAKKAAENAIVPEAAPKTPKGPSVGTAPNGGKPWTPAEEWQIMKAYAEDVPVPEIAQRVGRGILAVEARLVRLGKMSQEQRTIQIPVK